MVIRVKQIYLLVSWRYKRTHNMPYWECIELKKIVFGFTTSQILASKGRWISHCFSIRAVSDSIWQCGSNVRLTEDATGNITRIKRPLFRDRQVLEHLTVWYVTNYRSRLDLNYIVWNSERKPFLTQGTNKQPNDFIYSLKGDLDKITKQCYIDGCIYVW